MKTRPASRKNRALYERLCSFHLRISSSRSFRTRACRRTGTFSMPRVSMGPVEGDRSEEPCRSFQLSTQDAQAFFRNARFIRAHQIHYEYAWYPCSQKGMIFAHGRHYRWSISPGGTAAVDPEGQRPLLLACDCYEECLRLFPWGGNEFFFEEDESSSHRSAKPAHQKPNAVDPRGTPAP